jgi:nickel/cobalt transporter (NicO) family protein
MKRLLVAGAIACGLLLTTAPAVSAHPLGNFTINQYSGLRIGSDAVLIDIVVDMAEIPTFQLRNTIDSNRDGVVDDGESAAWHQQRCATEAGAVELNADGHAIAVEATPDGKVSFGAGQADLPTLRLECSLRAPLAATSVERTITYRNNNFDGRLGWREIVAVGDGATLKESDVPAVSTTSRLTTYPSNLLSSPLDQRLATMRVVTDGTAAAPVEASPAAVARPRGVDRATRAFTDLVGRQKLTLWFGLLAIGLAIVLGGIHAMAPGHGKTVLAAYIVGQHGSVRQAATIGATVTITHTAGVMALGLLLTSSAAIAPERLYPWLGLLSGLLVVGIGVTLGRRAIRMRRWLQESPLVAAQPEPEKVLVAAGHHDHHDHDHHDHDSHDHDHGHHGHHDHHDDHDHGHDDHHDHGYGHGHGHHDVAPVVAAAHSHGGRMHTHAPIDPSLGWHNLITVGFAGGLVPSPSALVVLLGAIALGRTWFGLLLVVAYGIGMAATLTGVGLLLVRARKLFDRRLLSGRRTATIARLSTVLPLISAVVIFGAGLALIARAAIQL